MSLYRPQSDSLSERMNKTLLDKARALLMETGLDRSYWGEAVMHAAKLNNRPVIEVQGMTNPHELF